MRSAIVAQRFATPVRLSPLRLPLVIAAHFDRPRSPSAADTAWQRGVSAVAAVDVVMAFLNPRTRRGGRLLLPVCVGHLVRSASMASAATYAAHATPSQYSGLSDHGTGVSWSRAPALRTNRGATCLRAEIPDARLASSPGTPARHHPSAWCQPLGSFSSVCRARWAFVVGASGSVEDKATLQLAQPVAPPGAWRVAWGQSSENHQQDDPACCPRITVTRGPKVIVVFPFSLYHHCVSGHRERSGPVRGEPLHLFRLKLG